VLFSSVAFEQDGNKFDVEVIDGEYMWNAGVLMGRAEELVEVVADRWMQETRWNSKRCRWFGIRRKMYVSRELTV